MADSDPDRRDPDLIPGFVVVVAFPGSSVLLKALLAGLLDAIQADNRETPLCIEHIFEQRILTPSGETIVHSVMFEGEVRSPGLRRLLEQLKPPRGSGTGSPQPPGTT